MCVCSIVFNFCDPMGYSLPGSSVHGIFQAGILEWIAIPYSGSFPDPGIKSTSQVSFFGGWILRLGVVVVANTDFHLIFCLQQK